MQCLLGLNMLLKKTRLLSVHQIPLSTFRRLLLSHVVIHMHTPLEKTHTTSIDSILTCCSQPLPLFVIGPCATRF